MAERGAVGTMTAGVFLRPCARIFIMSLLAGRNFLWDLGPCEMVMFVSYWYCVTACNMTIQLGVDIKMRVASSI